ncbi:MAG: hypothetical protein FJZ01_04920 [Candidatus Sericytochromatia bacterium]|nr:hypothetical protein [Candidatus Tanganyikabacteria bacterium]
MEIARLAASAALIALFAAPAEAHGHFGGAIGYVNRIQFTPAGLSGAMNGVGLDLGELGRGRKVGVEVGYMQLLTGPPGVSVIGRLDHQFPLIPGVFTFFQTTGGGLQAIDWDTPTEGVLTYQAFASGGADLALPGGFHAAADAGYAYVRLGPGQGELAGPFIRLGLSRWF